MDLIAGLFMFIGSIVAVRVITLIVVAKLFLDI